MGSPSSRPELRACRITGRQPCRRLLLLDPGKIPRHGRGKGEQVLDCGVGSGCHLRRPSVGKEGRLRSEEWADRMLRLGRLLLWRKRRFWRLVFLDVLLNRTGFSGCRSFASSCHGWFFQHGVHHASALPGEMLRMDQPPTRMDLYMRCFEVFELLLQQC